MNAEQALVAMSGGVDSSVAAFLVQKMGIPCIGANMKLYCPGESELPGKDSEDARTVAEKLGIPFQLLDFRREFDEEVIQKFIRSYEDGFTPNPCVDCNRTLKFGYLLKSALAMGCSHIVTGHYARIRFDEASGRYLLCKARDLSKDQSYFLACLNQEQLRRILFPLGELTKEEARAIALENDLITARKRDSQDICFVPDGDYVAFMERYTGKQYPGGNYLDLDGKIIGTHRGAVCYTLGQRKGLGIALGAPAYVCAKDTVANTVTLGPNEALFSGALRANHWNWYPFEELTGPLRVNAKTRHSQHEQSATVYPEDNGFARVEFDAKQRAVTPGQAVVLYQGDTVIGGGTIVEAIR